MLTRALRTYYFTIVPAPINSLYGTDSFLRSQQSLIQSKNSQRCMETEGSLPCSQEPATGLYPESDESGPSLHLISLRLHFNIIIHQRLSLPSGFFPSGFPTITLYARFYRACYKPCPSHPRWQRLVFKIVSDK
jgi:hypothetical protein